MSYSKQGSRGSGHWYTFWCVHPKEEIENRDTAIFEVCGVTQFSAKELRDSMDACISKVTFLDKEASKSELDELRIYMKEFLIDVNKDYPMITNNLIQKDAKQMRF